MKDDEYKIEADDVVERRLRSIEDAGLPDSLSSSRLLLRFAAQLDAADAEAALAAAKADGSAKKQKNNVIDIRRLRRPISIAAALVVVVSAVLAVERIGLFPSKDSVTESMYMSSSAAAADDIEEYAAEGNKNGLPDAETSGSISGSAKQEAKNELDDSSRSTAQTNPTTGGNDSGESDSAPILGSENSVPPLNPDTGGGGNDNGLTSMPADSIYPDTEYDWVPLMMNNADLYFPAPSALPALPAGCTAVDGVTGNSAMDKYLAANDMGVTLADIYPFLSQQSERPAIVRGLGVFDSGSCVMLVERYLPRVYADNENPYTGDDLSVSFPTSEGVSLYTLILESGEYTVTAPDGSSVIIPRG